MNPSEGVEQQKEPTVVVMQISTICFEESWPISYKPKHTLSLFSDSQRNGECVQI